MNKELITHRNPKSPIAEIFRTLRTNIQFMNSNKELKSLLVTSTVPTEGKSWVSSNLAVTFAQAGLRVVLVDADMRKGRLHKLFEIISRPGLSNYLSGVTENNLEKGNIANYIRETAVPNLYVMPAGNIPPNPSELLVTPQMITLLDELKKQSDLVIIDGTPAKLVTDSVILSRIVDSTIVVAAHNQTKKDEIEKTVKDIQKVGGNVAGVVYNKVPVQAKEYTESYYYVSDSEFKNIPAKKSEPFSEKTEQKAERRIMKKIEKSEEIQVIEPKKTTRASRLPKIEPEKVSKLQNIEAEPKEKVAKIPGIEVKEEEEKPKTTRRRSTKKADKEEEETPKKKTTRATKTTTTKTTRTTRTKKTDKEE